MTKLEKLKTNPLGQIIWIAVMCGLHIFLLKSKINAVDVRMRIVRVILAIVIVLPFHELIHFILMKLFSKGNARIEFAKDPIGLPGLRSVLSGEVTKGQRFIITIAPLVILTVILDIIFIFCERIDLLFFAIATCNSAGCYYDVIDAAVRLAKKQNN